MNDLQVLWLANYRELLAEETTPLLVAARAIVLSAHRAMREAPDDWGAYIAHLAADSIIREWLAQRVVGIYRCGAPVLATPAYPVSI